MNSLNKTKKKNIKLLIFIVAYNAEKTLETVLNRIPEEVFEYNYEILIIDDSSTDKTFSIGKKLQRQNKDKNIVILFNPDNQGYGGNQKLGYHYAVTNNFDAVVLLHGDGQYPPEMIEDLISPIINDNASAVFGSRMIQKFAALKGGMPIYKYIGNKILTGFQNFLLNANLSEFHSGFRAYSVKALASLPFERNSNDFHFDTQIIIQLIAGSHKITEIEIPTYYGDEICYVNGLNYAFNVVKTTLLYKLHTLSVLYQREYDLKKDDNTHYNLKLGYSSSHTKAIDRVRPGARVLDIGCGQGLVIHELIKKQVKASGIDQFNLKEEPCQFNYTRADLENPQSLPALDSFDFILVLDLIEHLSNPEAFLDAVRKKSRLKQPTVIISTGNIAFFIIRLQLLFSHFNYGKQGILDLTHKRLFTFKTLKKLLQQSGYVITKIEGIPAPFPKAIGLNFISKTMLFINRLLIKLSRSLFSYQIYMEARPTPVVSELLKYSIRESKKNPNQKDELPEKV